MGKWLRVLITTVVGFILGIACLFITNAAGAPFWPLGISWVLHHTVMGFTIGVSGWKMHWAAHGTVWGALFGIFTAVSVVGTVISPVQTFTIIVVWGFLIELIATKAFKRPQW